jgi:AraC-like DNA-binding protein
MEDETQFAVLLAALLQELGSCEQTVLSHEGVSAMVAYINANFASITGISQIAEQFYISKFHLCRVFREAMKVTVVEYLNRVRIQNACRYLRSSEKDVAEVAMLCGFHDAAYFSNVFKRVMGITPSAYRKE